MRMFAVAIKRSLALAIASSALATFGRPAAPLRLQVNGVSNPLAIDGGTDRPVEYGTGERPPQDSGLFHGASFTWTSKDNRRGERQTAYQILVASNPKQLTGGKADWWNSGKVNSDKSASVEYVGKPLPPATRFWWKVRIWDQTGQPGPYSAPAFFDTGLNHWTARCIWDGIDKANHFVYFRKTFVMTNTPSLAKVYVTAVNDYLLYCNGQLLGSGPARCDPYHYGQYNGYDITRLVKPGTDVFAAIGHKAIPWSGNLNLQPAFLLEARFSYPDGSSSTVRTDGSWKVLSHTAFVESHPTYFGSGRGNRAAIRFDSRREPAGWKEVGFDDSRWASATVVNCSRYHWFAQMAPMEREQAAIKPVTITRTNGAWLVKFGWCMDGWPKLTMHGNRPGSVVRVNYFQLTGERKPAGWDEYICHGGAETWDPDFGRYTSFQELRITGYAGKLRPSDVRGMWAYCNADVAGRFRCSSPLLNAIYKMCVRSARQNVQQGIIAVDAQREQLPWLADNWSIGNVLLYNDRDATIIDKVVRDFAGEQMSNGYIRNVSPGHGFEGADGHGRIPEWAMYWPMLLWQQYLFSGDETLLREMAPRVARLLDWLKPFRNPKTQLLNPLGMWRISEFAGGNMPSGGYNVATACEYYRDLDIASRVFSVLGGTNQSNEYRQEAEAVKAGINAYLFNGQYYLARTDTNKMFPLASAWPLRLNIEPAAARSKILAVIERAGKPDIGGYGGDAFYSGMLNAGSPRGIPADGSGGHSAGDYSTGQGGALVVRDLVRYRPMLDSNQACWEQFGLGGEVNHAWTAYPGYQFQKYFLGLQPTSGGFATFDIRPDTSGLTFAEGAVPSVKGLITTRWKKSTDGKFTLSVHVPANTRAAIYIPILVKGRFILTESGKALWPAQSSVEDPGVLAVSKERSSVKCTVGAGDYRFDETRCNVTGTGSLNGSALSLPVLDRATSTPTVTDPKQMLLRPGTAAIDQGGRLRY